jgi:muconate cycloisomerase
MKIKQVLVFEIAIPFKFTFRHALASRNKGNGVLVRLEDQDGHVGWGESAPRSYVTGETTDSVIDALKSDIVTCFTDHEFGDFESVTKRIEDSLKSLPRNRHAAFCAMELAVLDLAGKAFEQSCGDLAGPIVKESLAFSGVISADAVDSAIKACELVKKFGFTRVKLKIGLSLENDLQILRHARDILGDDVGIRVDANCAWTAQQALDSLEALREFRLEGVEQPLKGDDIEGLVWLTERSPTPVITDESLASLEDAKMLATRGGCHVFNIRISKCGGLLNSTRIRDLARRSGIDCMLGAQVGETAILSAAGRQFASRSPDLKFLEGSYGTILLESDIATTDLTIGPGGHADALSGFGLGVEVREDLVEPHVTNRYDLGAS